MLLNKISSLPRNIKRIILAASDILLLVISILFSFSLRLDEWYLPPGGFDNNISWLIIVAPIIAIPIFIYFGLYRAIIRYLGMHAAWSVVQAVSLYCLIWGLIAMLSNFPGVPRSVVIINTLVTLLAVGGSRMLARYILRSVEKSNQKRNISRSNRIRVLVYGAGAAGHQLATGMIESIEYELCGFIDDHKELQGRELLGVPIISRNDLISVIEVKKVTDIFLAIPSVKRSERSLILENLMPLPVRVKTLPSLSRLAKGSTDLSDIQELDIDDLLLRESLLSNEDQLESLINNKIVLVTGAGGSIGSEICRQTLLRDPKILLLFDVSEFALYRIHQELEEMCIKISTSNKIVVLPKIIPVLGSIQDEERLNNMMQTWNIDIVYHAAAYKHVPMVERNLSEGVKNNAIGTLKLAKVAIEQQVNKFVLISTDKAVNPTNGMGASKRVAEMILQALSKQKKVIFESINGAPIELQNKTQFSIVRFGNVLGSSGSVVPLFRKQINKGGPLTLTHKDITRYFMTTKEAVYLVMQSSAMNTNMKTAEVYVLDMGEPVKIMQLARRMIKLSGLTIKDKNHPDGDIQINTTGLRPGEKLYEELLIGDNPQPTDNPKILKADESYLVWHELQENLKSLQISSENNDVKVIIHILKSLVIGYKPPFSIVDFIFEEQNK